MKQTLYTLLSLFLLISCQQEDILSKQGKGYLQLTDLSLASPTIESVHTRAVDEDLYVEIIGTDNNTYEPGTFPSKIELEAGEYTLKAYNEAYKNKTANTPQYYVETTFTIQAEKVTYPTISVPMVNVGISLATLSDELQELFSDVKLSFYTTDEQTVTVLQPGETVYMDYAEDMAFTYTLTATNADNETFTTEKKIYGDMEGEKVKLGHCYVISYSLASPTQLKTTVNP
ncbi:DUF4493 domain-containing protein [uncultured Mediterranea sp.]|uniref:DUF4493 domain-containing protein n=1 Tax=uncultured Mediterranea sp. TaxID=1926662 RepID=UPI00280448F6|nr:DUF4493 domain-containing protein [uncultured Mediterranea sp.]